MRISDNRYSRDRLRLDLALRFIHHQARTRTIRTWTGLTDDRIRKLYRDYVNEPGANLCRPRGKSPQRSAFFTRSVELQEETAVLASLCCLLGVLPRAGAPVSRQALANISRGELLCQAFEVYRELVEDPRISFEHLVYLVFALAGGEEIQLACCAQCGALAVVDRMALKACLCPYCASRAD